MRRLGQEMPALDFTVTARGPVFQGSDDLPPGVASCDEWAQRLIAGEDLPLPTRESLCFPALRDAALVAPVPHTSPPVDDWLGRAWANLTGALSSGAQAIGQTVGSGVAAAGQGLAPDFSGALRVLLFAGIGVAALYVLAPVLRGRR